MRAGTIPRRALRPDRVLESLLQHVVGLARRRLCGSYACGRSKAHECEKLEDEDEWDLGFFGGDHGCVASGRVRACPNERDGPVSVIK